MVPPRRKRSASRPVHLSLPGDTFARIDAKAKASVRPFYKIVIDELTDYPRLEQQPGLGDLVRSIDITLAHHKSRIAWADLNDALLEAVDRLLAVQGRGQALAAMDGLKVARRAMLTQAALDERT